MKYLIQTSICIIYIFMSFTFVRGQISNDQKGSSAFQKQEISHQFLRGDIYKKALIQSKAGFSKSNMQFFEVGDTTSFFVRNIFDPTKWNKVNASLVLDTLSISIWIDTSSTNLSNINIQQIVYNLKNQLLYNTPQYSVDPGGGIIPIMIEFFGEPPNVDGDGKTDILLLDIQDDFENSGAYVAGFFDPNDLTDNEFSNKRDMIYIDLYPTIYVNGKINVENGAATIAHEYQHLIHINYEENPWEYVFINEGLSELAEIVCGYPPRSAEPFFRNSSRSLFSWNHNDPLPDYSRASLWTNYLFEQIGYEQIRKLVQSPLSGLEDIQNLLSTSSSKSFDEVFADWSVASVINDTSENVSYGYRHPLRKNIKLSPDESLENLPVVKDIVLPKQSSALLDFPFIYDLKIHFQNDNAQLRTDGIIIYPDTSMLLKEIFSEPIHIKAEDYAHGSISLLLINKEKAFSEDDEIQTFKVIAEGKKQLASKLLSYDDGLSDTFYQNASYFLLNGYTQKLAIAFEPEKQAWLKSISLKTIFLSELQGSSFLEAEQRDINIQIASIKNGNPDIPLIEPRQITFTRNFGNLKFEDFNLNDQYEKLSSIQDSFCIVLSNDEDDSNFVAVGMDRSMEEHTSAYLDYGRNGFFSWQSMDSVNIDGNHLTGFNGMVRAHIVMENERFSGNVLSAHFTHTFNNISLSIDAPFILDSIKSKSAIVLPNGDYMTASSQIENYSAIFNAGLQVDGSYSFIVHLEEQNGLAAVDTVYNWILPYPASFTVYNNYPNPFNGSTTIPFILLERGMVNYDIFNILGQKINSENVGEFQNGSHKINLDFKNSSSGIYFVRLQMNSENKKLSHTQKVVLIK